MMRWIFTLLFFANMPAIAMAVAFSDACTNPNEYTIDRRCYVTDAQKQQKPFSATVAMVWPNGNSYCTGTIIKGYGNDPDGIYIYTAKHCSDRNRDGVPDINLTIKMQDAKQYTVEYVDAGAYDISTEENLDGDYAIYKINNTSNDIPYTELSTKSGWGGIRPISARVIGYGSLAIMSDDEIASIKDKYIKFLESDAQDKDALTYDGGLELSAQHATKFFKKLDRDDMTLFTDDQLKVSECRYFSTGAKLWCQSWGGNSGGGIFDNNDRLMGINTRGAHIIGGKYHAGKNTFDWDTITNGASSIPIAFE